MPTTDVLTRGNGPERSMVFTDTSLTALNILKQGLELKFQHVLPGDRIGIDGAPLLVSNVELKDGRTMKLAIYATEGNLLCAFDAFGPAMIWAVQVGDPILSVREIDEWGTNDNFGIMGTPVIHADRERVTFISWVSPNGAAGYAQHFVNSHYLSDGTPVHPPLSCEGLTYLGASGIEQKFVTAIRKQRGALLQDNNGIIHIPFGSVSEAAGTSRGWIVSYDPTLERITACLPTISSAKGFGAGLWNAGGGLALHKDGNLLAATSNGTFDPPYDFAESLLKVAYTGPTTPTGMGKLEVVDWVTFWTDDARESLDPTGVDMGIPSASNKRAFDQAGNVGWNDMDFGSGAPQPSQRTGVVYVGTKDGIIYPINGTVMGRTMPADLANPHANYQTLAAPAIFGTYYPPGLNPMPNDIRTLNVLWDQCTHHVHGEMVLWNGPDVEMLYVCGENGNPRAFHCGPTGGLIYEACAPQYASPDSPRPPGGMPGGNMVLSWDWQNAGTAVLFVSLPYGDANMSVTQGRLLVYDATRFSKYADGSGSMVTLWDSQDWGIAYKFGKFCRQAVSEGLFYNPTHGATIDVYGLAGG